MIEFYVSKNDNAQFSSIQEALDSLPVTTETITLHIGPGVYREKLFVRHNNLRIIGESPETTTLTYFHGARSLGPDNIPMGTFNSFSIIVCGHDICVENIRIENTSGPGVVNGQAVAAFITSDRTSFYNCHFIGFQDTIYCGMMSDDFLNRIFAPKNFKNSEINVFFNQNQVYFDNCYVEGDVDYIFGSGLAYFNNCHIHTVKLESEGNMAYITAANTPVNCEFGFIFNSCNISGEAPFSAYLGRPWRDYAKTIFCGCTLDKSIHKKGWHNWDKPFAELTLQYIEINNNGEGSSRQDRCHFSKCLSNPDLPKLLEAGTILRDFNNWLKPINQY